MSDLSVPLNLNKVSFLNDKRRKFNNSGLIERNTSGLLIKKTLNSKNRQDSAISLNDSVDQTEEI